jgi:predicted  nucleic acid-binding Zn-ribbon protein
LFLAKGVRQGFVTAPTKFLHGIIARFLVSVTFSIVSDLTRWVRASAKECHENQAMDAEGSGVQTDYLRLDNTGVCFTNTGDVPPVDVGGQDKGVDRFTNKCDEECVTCDDQVLSPAAASVRKASDKWLDARAQIDNAKAKAEEEEFRFQGQINDLQNNLEAKQETKAELEAEGERLDQDLQEVEQAIADLANATGLSPEARRQQQLALEAQKASLQEAIASNNKALADTNANIAETTAKLNEVNASYAEFRTRTETNFGQLNEAVTTAAQGIEQALIDYQEASAECNATCNGEAL